MRGLYALVLMFVISVLFATSSAEMFPRFKRQYGSMGGMGGSQSYGQSSQMGSSMGGSQMGGGSPMGGMGGWGR